MLLWPSTRDRLVMAPGPDSGGSKPTYGRAQWPDSSGTGMVASIPAADEIDSVAEIRPTTDGAKYCLESIRISPPRALNAASTSAIACTRATFRQAGCTRHAEYRS